MIRLCVAYDGSGFSGYQVQPGKRTVQGVLESALGKLANGEVRVRAAGRTDAGVHALGQVVSVDVPSLDPAMVRRGMPALLPPDVAVVDAQPASEDFDARRLALSRTYAYLLWCAGTPHPLYRKYAVWPRERFDAARAGEALRTILGTNDFSSFSRGREDQTPERTVLEAYAVTDGPFVRIKVVAESFLHQMVRSIVGTAMEIGTGRKPVSWMREVLEARDRSAAGPVAPAHGLTLIDVSYEGVEWPNRPAVTWPWSGLAYANPQRGCA